MHRTASITCYDMFGQIFVGARIRDHDATGEVAEEPEFACSALVPSTGESEPIEWLQQALMGYLEAL